jgi:hypothetical protein
MSEPLDSSRHPTRERLLASPSLRGLPAGAEALPAEVVLGDLPWDGPVVDPERLDARSLLARLR